MAQQAYRYVIVGAGLAGASAVEGIRERDPDGAVLLLGKEEHLPYHRPPLSKQLWSGKKQVQDIFIHDEAFYRDANVELALGAAVVGLDAASKTITDSDGSSYGYEKLLLATGGDPRKLDIPGGDLEGIRYFRDLDDYQAVRDAASEGTSATVIGGGFIGSEMAAALNGLKAAVTMVFPHAYLVPHVFPEDLGLAIQEDYVSRGVTILSGDVPASIERKGDGYLTRTRNGEEIESDVVIVGIGVEPSTDLAGDGGLAVENGIVVNARLETSDPSIYAAGDNAFFPYQALGRRARIEHWDAAESQGKHAGRNMSGASDPFTYMPYFFSDLFDFGYEAVGDTSARLETVADWQKENDTGVVYYLKDGRVRGVMMCNVWDKVDAARELISQGTRVTAEDLRGAIQ